MQFAFNFTLDSKVDFLEKT